MTTTKINTLFISFIYQVPLVAKFQLTLFQVWSFQHQ